MRTKIFYSARKVANWFLGLKRLEKGLIGGISFFLLLFIYQQLSGFVGEQALSSKQGLIERKNNLQDVAAILKRYTSLRRHREELQSTYAQSQMTFEQVSNELDRIVRDAIGSDNYELKKPHPPAPFGFEYEKQEFSLTVKMLTLDQLVKLLYQIEQGDKPIFLSKVDINKTLSGTDYGASLEIYSISKTVAAKPTES